MDSRTSGETAREKRHSFVLRIRLDEGSAGRSGWSGQITHVESSKGCYFKDLNRLSRFLALYLEEMKARLSMSWRLRLWWSRLWRGAA